LQKLEHAAADRVVDRAGGGASGVFVVDGRCCIADFAGHVEQWDRYRFRGDRVVRGD
jgi:hypothetical protein